MAFILAKMGVGQTPPIKYKAVKAGEDVVLGEALTDGTTGLTKCAATAKPDFVAVGPKNAEGEAPVVKVESYMEFDAPLAAAPAEGVTLASGVKVTLHTDGLQVTATTTGGVAIITRVDGTAVGDTVGVRF